MFTEINIPDLNLSLPVSIDRVLNNIRNKPSNNKKENNKNNPRKNFNPLNIAHLILFGFLVAGNFRTVFNEDSNKLIYNARQCEAVISEFKASYWKYIADENIKKTSDFSDANITNIKEIFWNIIIEKRKLFSHMPQGLEVMKELKVTYSHKDFIQDFDYFIQKHKHEPLDKFSENIFKYVEQMQNKISRKIFKY